jgi:uncharacterized protein YjeT (DUF2065 family)
MGSALLLGLALMLVFEGLLPFLSPARWRAVMAKVMHLSDGQIRFLGLLGLAFGLLLLLLGS